MNTRSRAKSVNNVCKKIKLEPIVTKPLIFENRYADCWVPILDYVRLEDIIKLRAIHPEFKVIVEQFFAKGVVKIDDWFFLEYPFNKYKRLYSHIGQRATQLRLAYIYYDSDLVDILFEYFQDLQELTMVSVSVCDPYLDSRTLRVQNLKVIHCDMEDNDISDWFILVNGLLTLYKSTWTFLRVIPNIRHLRFIDTSNFWDGFDNLDHVLESLELRVGTLSANTIQAEPLKFSKLKRLVIKAHYMWGDWNILFPALEYLSLDIPDSTEQRFAFKNCYGNEIASWKCAKKLKTLIVPFHTHHVRWLKTFRTLQELTVLDKDVSYGADEFETLSSTHPSLKVVQLCPESPKPASIFDYLPDKLLLKIIRYLDDNLDGHGLVGIEYLDPRFAILKALYKQSYKKGTRIDKEFMDKDYLYKSFSIYPEFGKRVTRLYLDGLSESQVSRILPYFRKLTFLRLDKISLMDNAWDWFPTGLQEIELAKDVTIPNWNLLYKERLAGLDTINAPVWALEPVQDIKHLVILLSDLQADLSAFWKRNKGIESLKITGNSIDTTTDNSDTVARNWKAIGGLKKLRSFSCNFLEAPLMKLPFKTLEEVHILDPICKPMSCGFLNQLGPRLRVLSIDMVNFPDKDMLPQALLRLASTLERLEFTDKFAFWSQMVDVNILKRMTKLKCLQYPFGELDYVLDLFEDLPKLTEVKLNPRVINELNWAKMRVFQRDLAYMETLLARPMIITFTPGLRGM